MVVVVLDTVLLSVVDNTDDKGIDNDAVDCCANVCSFSFDAAPRIATVSVAASAVLLSTKMMSSIVVVLLVDDRDDNDDERAMMFVGAGNTVGLNVSEGANVSEGG